MGSRHQALNSNNQPALDKTNGALQRYLPLL
jgi:hypothetical protein